MLRRPTSLLSSLFFSYAVCFSCFFFISNTALQLCLDLVPMDSDVKRDTLPCVRFSFDDRRCRDSYDVDLGKKEEREGNGRDWLMMIEMAETRTRTEIEDSRGQ